MTLLVPDQYHHHHHRHQIQTLDRHPDQHHRLLDHYHHRRHQPSSFFSIPVYQCTKQLSEMLHHPLTRHSASFFSCSSLCLTSSSVR